MNNKIMDLNIDIKIHLLAKRCYDNVEKFKKIVIKEFGSIDYQYNGDSLLHLLAKKSDKIDIWEFIHCTEKLIELGVDPNTKNLFGENYFTVFCKINSLGIIIRYITNNDIDILEKLDLNTKTNSGKTIMHEIIDTHKLINEYDLRELYFIFNELIKNGYMDISGSEKVSRNVFKLLEKNLKSEKSFSKNTIDEFMLKLKNEYYSKYSFEFARLLIFDDKQLHKSIVESVFNCTFDNGLDLDKLNLLSNVQVKDVSNEERLGITRKLLDLGCDPNYRKENYNFIETAIINNLELDYIIKIIELAFQYGFNPNSYAFDTILKLVLTNRGDEEATKMYVFLSKYNFNYSGLKRELTCRLFDDSIRKNMRIEGLKIMFNVLTQEFNLTLDAKLSDDIELFEIIFDIIDSFNINTEAYNDYQFINEILKSIAEDRNSCININNAPINHLNIIEKIKIVSSKLINQKLDKYLVKRNDNYE